MVGSIDSNRSLYGFKIDVVLENSETHYKELTAGVNKIIKKLSYVLSDYTGAGDITIKIYVRAKSGTWFEATTTITKSANAHGIIDVYTNEIKVECIAAAGNTAKILINLLME